jgi:filamentous hemagglutinin family protein
MTKKAVGSSALCTFSLPIMVLLLLGSFVLPSFNLSRSQAHAASPITPSGLNTQVNLAPTPPPGKVQYDITGGTRPGGGVNLFHSFGDFNVPNNNIANFLNNSGLATSNILGRVTGGNISNIFGTIQTTGFGSANLFMMNPAGFLFGPTATLNVGGMVTFTSADYLRLADGVKFNTVAGPADALISVAPIAAFGFLTPSPAPITLQGTNLQVLPGQAISLIGGDIQVQASQVSAPAGLIQMASVASPGEVVLGPPGLVLDPLNVSSFSSLGRIDLQSSAIDVNGSATVPVGGAILIRGGQFVMENSLVQSITVALDGGPISVIAPIIQMKGGQIQTATGGDGAAGNISVNAGKIDLASGALISSSSGLFLGNLFLAGNGAGGNIHVTATDSISIAAHSALTPTRPSGLLTTAVGGGPGGNITVQAAQLQMQEGAVISAETRGPGPAGDLTLDVASASLNGGALISSNTFSSGKGGQVTVRATESLTLSGETADPVIIGGITFPHLPSGISSAAFADGQGGRLTVSAPRLTMQKGVIGAQSERLAPGNAGEVVVDAGRLVLTEGALITASTAGAGQGGNVTVRATDSISIDGHRTDAFPSGTTILTNAPSGIFTNTYGTGQGGVISVSSPILTMGEVQGSGEIGANTFGPGNAGNILVEVGSLTLRNGATISGTTLGTGDGGTVAVRATDSISISGRHPGSFGIGSLVFKNNQSGIISLALAEGKGGHISVSTADLSLHDEGVIAAPTGGAGAAGDVVVNTGTLSLTSGGQINSGSGFKIGDTLFVGEGAGGIVTVNASGPVAISDQGSGLFTSAVGNGAGGNINLRGSGIQLSNGASISATSAGIGNAGNITINAGNQFAMTNSSVTTEANQSSGGAIKITTNPNGTVQLTDSVISASVLDGTGGGGSVNIDPQFVLLQNSQILANAVFGPGGNIFITSNLLLPDSTSIISASSQFGQQGTITIQSPIAPASGKIIPLPQKPLVPISLLSQRCAALAQGNFSSFTVAGRDSLPAEPSSWLASPLPIATGELVGSTASEPDTPTSLSEPSDETPVLSLRRIAPPGFLTQSFAVDGSGCTS